MIGNDIIDLDYARQSSNWQRPGWLQKLFTPAEQQYILQSDDPEFTLWLFWSMKESAYKIIVREEQRRFFAPKQLHCTLALCKANLSIGSVQFQSKTYTTKSTWDMTSIHTIASAAGKSEPMDLQHQVLVKPKGGEDRNWLYKKIITTLCSEAKFPAGTPRIKKNTLGIPQIFFDSTQQSSILSISHHGRFAAFAYMEMLSLEHV